MNTFKQAIKATRWDYAKMLVWILGVQWCTTKPTEAMMAFCTNHLIAALFLLKIINIINMQIEQLPNWNSISSKDILPIWRLKLHLECKNYANFVEICKFNINIITDWFIHCWNAMYKSFCYCIKAFMFAINFIKMGQTSMNCRIKKKKTFDCFYDKTNLGWAKNLSGTPVFCWSWILTS